MKHAKSKLIAIFFCVAMLLNVSNVSATGPVLATCSDVQCSHEHTSEVVPIEPYCSHSYWVYSKYNDTQHMKKCRDCSYMTLESHKWTAVGYFTYTCDCGAVLIKE